MVRNLFHGSEYIIKKPLYGYGKTYNDYGLGFYCTEIKDLAKEWAVARDRNGFANCYTLDCDGLKILNLSEPTYTVLHWLAILLQNRSFEVTAVLAAEAKDYLLTNFLPRYEEYDAIVGYRADDSYFAFAKDFLNGAISYRQLGNALRLGKLGEQFVLKSKAAFDRICFAGSEEASIEEWYELKTKRDQAARQAYFNLERNRRQRGDLYITQILDEGMISDDPRLR